MGRPHGQPGPPSLSYFVCSMGVTQRMWILVPANSRRRTEGDGVGVVLGRHPHVSLHHSPPLVSENGKNKTQIVISL